MDKASDSESGGPGFDSHQGHIFVFRGLGGGEHKEGLWRVGEEAVCPVCGWEGRGGGPRPHPPYPPHVLFVGWVGGVGGGVDMGGIGKLSLGGDGRDGAPGMGGAGNGEKRADWRALHPLPPLSPPPSVYTPQGLRTVQAWP